MQESVEKWKTVVDIQRLESGKEGDEDDGSVTARILGGASNETANLRHYMVALIKKKTLRKKNVMVKPR